MHSVNNKEMGTVYVISRHEGDGHIQMTLRKVDGYFEVSANYVKFFEINGAPLYPSKELKTYLGYIRKTIAQYSRIN